MAPVTTGDDESGRNKFYQNLQTCQPYQNLYRESERLKTLKNWPVNFLDSKKLAKNGLYYTGRDDVVKCAFCEVQIGCWEHGDDPERDHRRDSPDCPLINGEECGNRGLSETGEEVEGSQEEEETSQDVCGSYMLDIRPFSGPERPGKSPLAIEAGNLWRNFEDLGVSKVSGPVAPHFATCTARIKTFENWPVPEIQSPERLAEAGFYYTCYNDNVLCFHCGGGLKNWEVEDDPWVEHARWFSRCGYVIMRKGKAFISEVLASEELLRKSLKETSQCEKRAEKQNPPCEKKTEKTSSKETPATSSNTSTSSTSTASDEDSEKPQNEKEIALCRICYVREREIVFLPCGHFVSCTECAPSLSTCAVCRKPFEATVRAYLS